MPELSILLQLGQAIFAAILVSSYGIIIRHVRNSHLSSAIIGCLFGLGAMVSMISPIDIGNGAIVDLRNLFIGVSFAYFGWVGGGFTLMIAIGTRLAIGGDGALAGIAAMALAGGFGFAWRLWVRPRLGNTVMAHLSLGGMITMSLFGALVAPEPIRRFVIVDLGPTLFLFYVLGSLMLGGLLEREITLIRQADVLLKSALTDPLTGVPNRRGLQALLLQISGSAMRQNGLAMICFDIDRFKQVNDRYGHMAGDDLLREVTARVRSCLRAEDHLARHGGDEFIIIQGGLTHAEALATAERCRAKVSETPINFGSGCRTVTISIGVDWVPEFDEFETLFSRADKALYDAKQGGRNLVRAYIAEAA